MPITSRLNSLPNHLFDNLGICADLLLVFCEQNLDTHKYNPKSTHNTVQITQHLTSTYKSGSRTLKRSKNLDTRTPSTRKAPIGDERYVLFRGAAHRISTAVNEGFYLEAITLIESILAERLEKRAQYLYKTLSIKSKEINKVKDGFQCLGPLIIAINKHERSQDVLMALKEIDAWRESRNRALHEMVKIGSLTRDPWQERIDEARKIAVNGITVLLKYDKIDRDQGHSNIEHPVRSATCPDALFEIGQEDCKYCSEG